MNEFILKIFLNNFLLWLILYVKNTFRELANAILTTIIILNKIQKDHKLIYNKLYIGSATGFFTSILILTSFTVSIFALSDGSNQTEQRIFKETNQTIISPSSDETGQVIPIQKNATDLGGNITDNAQNIVTNIGKAIKNLTK